MIGRSSSTGSAAWLVLLTLLAPAPAAAQYDRDGRYVPSPMGVPADPYARPIPGYAGKPGAARGTPALPRAYDIQPPPAPVLRREPDVRKVYPGTLPLIHLSKAQCRDGWSRETGMPRVEFNRRCRRILGR